MRHGMLPNLKPKKTAFILAARGPGAQKARRQFFPKGEKVLKLRDLQLEVTVASQYVHLGGLIDVDMKLQMEARRRLSMAKAAFDSGKVPSLHQCDDPPQRPCGSLQHFHHFYFLQPGSVDYTDSCMGAIGWWFLQVAAWFIGEDLQGRATLQGGVAGGAHPDGCATIGMPSDQSLDSAYYAPWPKQRRALFGQCFKRNSCGSVRCEPIWNGWLRTAMTGRPGRKPTGQNGGGS